MSTISGITYIKINRIDSEGNDNTLTLQGLTNLRIKYSDIGIKDYPVYSISEYLDYYLYQIYTTDITSSTDNNIRDYTLNVTSSGGTYNGSVTPIDYDFSNDSGGPITWAITTDTQNYFDSATQSYIFENTPNIFLTCSFTASSISWAGISPGPIFYITSNIRGILKSYQTIGTSPSSVYFHYTGSFFNNESLKIQYSTYGGTMSPSNVNFRITQSSVPISSLNLVVLEPYVTENFELSDCNVLYGNIDSYPFNPIYMDVDYSTNGMIAVNTDQIISGFATRSNVKPYYYSLKRHIIPRYNGSKNIDRGTFEFDTVSQIAATYLLQDYDSNGSPNLIPTNNINIGDDLEIYQNGVFKGIATIIDKKEFGISLPNLNSPIPNVKKIKLDTGISGIAHLIPNIFENSDIYPLDIFNSNIFEYRYGANTFPEIPNAGILVMGNILEVADQNKVNVLQQSSQYFEAYNKIINDTFIPNTTISDIRQYGDGSKIVLNDLQIITSDFGIPTSPQNSGEIVEYWIPTNNSTLTSAVETDGVITFSPGGGAYEIELNELGQYITASSGLIPSHSVVHNITSSLANGERWFATIYEKLPNPLDQTSLSPYKGYSLLTGISASDASYSLLSRGIYEIISGSDTTLNLNYIVARTPNSITFGDGAKGLILWKASVPLTKQGKYVIVSKPSVKDLGPGAIVLPYSNQAIDKYFNEITTTYGSNTKPPTNKPNLNNGFSSGPSENSKLSG